MKKLRYFLCGTLFISLTLFSYMQSNVASNMNIDLANILGVNNVQAEEGNHPCMTTGYKNWGGSWSNPDGKDCDCNDREDVSNNCQ